MNRYQVYLNPVSVDLIDEVAEYEGISRSKIIQELVDRRVQNYLKFAKSKPDRQQKSALLKMAGMLKGATSKSLVTDIDDIVYQ